MSDERWRDHLEMKTKRKIPKRAGTLTEKSGLAKTRPAGPFAIQSGLCVKCGEIN